MLRNTIAAAAAIGALASAGLGAGAAFAAAYDTAPASYRGWIDKAAQGCDHPSVTPQLIAAQLRVDSNYQAVARSPVGAEGSAQFLPREWALYGVDADHNGRVSPYDIADAVVALGREDCALAKQLDARKHRSSPADISAARIGGIDQVDRPEVAAYNTSILAQL